MENSSLFVRSEMLAALPPPKPASGIVYRCRTALFGSVRDGILTVLALILLGLAAPPAFDWLIANAAWEGTSRSVCATISQGGIRPEGWSGACWAFVDAKMDQFVFGRYTLEERWRPVIVFALFAALLVPLLVPRLPYKAINAVLLFVALPLFSGVLLLGGVFGLPYVETSLWGGLLVTLTLSYVGIVASLPLGVGLALGRRSELPVVRVLATTFIEVVRGIPLLAVLFMASVVLPLFLPSGVTIDKFVRALVGVSLFASAYMAEVIRGGLQAVPRGQYEGADALGLSHVQKTLLVVLPQALKLVIPGIVNTFIGLFKDTSLVTIIAMFDLLGIVRLNFSDTNWSSPVTPVSGLLFVGAIFWVFCFSMSRYSIAVEKRLETGHKR